MAHKTLEINVISATDLKNVNLIDKMDVYAVVSLKGDSWKHRQKMKTPVDKDCGKNPTWNFPVKFTMDESLAKNNEPNLKFRIKCERTLGDKELGQVNIPVKELLDSPGEGSSIKFVRYQVTNPSGRPEGTLNFSYKIGDKVSKPVKSEKSKGDQPVAAYPTHMAAGSSSAPYGVPVPYLPPQTAGYGYPPPPVAAAYGGYAYGGYPQKAPPPPGYGYPPPRPPPGYVYPPPGGYGYPAMQQPPKKNSKFGLGLGVGLLGGAIGAMLI
ncbi:protein SRC2-like [Durio zibethinus]|uniref:Protein SRC2-like n=1 Tax=Durio zibethinus TaxID=66656 RepID=A0A6P5Z923_DURZI|nr:protein SRC2-like [Durio zibethinus]